MLPKPSASQTAVSVTDKAKLEFHIINADASLTEEDKTKLKDNYLLMLRIEEERRLTEKQRELVEKRIEELKLRKELGFRPPTTQTPRLRRIPPANLSRSHPGALFHI